MPSRLLTTWAPWWIAAPLFIGNVAGASSLYRTFGEPGQMTRVMLSPYALLGALVFPAVFNSRIVRVGRGVSVDHDDILTCVLPYSGSRWRLLFVGWLVALLAAVVAGAPWE